MRNLFLTAVFLFSTLCLNAQSKLAVENQYPGDAKAQEVYLTAVEKQANEKTSALRTTWMANKPSSNWFISGFAGIGGNWSGSQHLATKPWKAFDKDVDGMWNPVYGGSIGKWFTPVWGLRVNGFYGKYKAFELTDQGHHLRGFSESVNGTIDFMVNLKNVFRPYNPKGFFNPVLFVGTGFNYTWENDSKVDPIYGDKTWDQVAGNGVNTALKGGLQLNFRLHDRWDLFLEGQALYIPKGFDRWEEGESLNSDVISNLLLGLTYRFDFRHFIKAPMYDQREIDALNREINELRNRPEVICPPIPVCPEPEVIVKEVAAKEELTPVFFTINSSVVRDNQLISVAKAAEYLIDNPNAKLELASYADKKTGNPSYNMRLSKNRSEAVAKVLVNKFGIKRDRLVLKHYGDTVQPFEQNDWNRVTIFVLP
ncbi:MAG: OmpA family protein [Dysgonamonadaceae bacterium]|jgi:outer membrane protein OmpA-like peptidoglycan-associated protein|nr:OmpA family protein [Dysgonamonadaceae bacterium]